MPAFGPRLATRLAGDVSKTSAFLSLRAGIWNFVSETAWCLRGPLDRTLSCGVSGMRRGLGAYDGVVPWAT